jgi:hypothetical protein
MYSEEQEIVLLTRLHTILQHGTSVGLDLCKMSLLDVTLGSETERRQWSIHYLQEGRLRAYVEISRNILHGEFFVFYPDGKLWIRGAYRNNKLIGEAMKVFMPDGTLLKPKPLPSNVVPLQKKNAPNNERP